MRLTVIQSQRTIRYKPESPGGPDLACIRSAARADVEAAFVLCEQAAEQRPDLIVTIETLNQSILFHDRRFDLEPEAEPLDGPLIRRFCDLTRRQGVHLVAGLLTRREGKVFNSAVLFGRDGRVSGVYDKVHLPVNEVRVTPGTAYPVFETDFGRLGLLICWDMQYPEAARALALNGAELIACPTWGWEKICGPARAYENGVTLAVAMGVMAGQPVWEGCDPSCVVANTGKILAEAPRTGEHIVTAEVDIHTGPPLQYGAEKFTTLTTMRDVRLGLRRPDTYGALTRSCSTQQRGG